MQKMGLTLYRPKFTTRKKEFGVLNTGEHQRKSEEHARIVPSRRTDVAVGDDDEGDSGVQDYLSVIESSAMDSKKTDRTEQQGAAAAAAAAETRRDPRRGPPEGALL
jgi:hypothetical protein